jgi:hypothetical protein
MDNFVWVEKESIDQNGEWLKVIKVENEKLLCERKNPFKHDIYILKSDVLQTTNDEIF